MRTRTYQLRPVAPIYPHLSVHLQRFIWVRVWTKISEGASTWNRRRYNAMPFRLQWRVEIWWPVPRRVRAKRRRFVSRSYVVFWGTSYRGVVPGLLVQLLLSYLRRGNCLVRWMVVVGPFGCWEHVWKEKKEKKIYVDFRGTRTLTQLCLILRFWFAWGDVDSGWGSFDAFSQQPNKTIWVCLNFDLIPFGFVIW